MTLEGYFPEQRLFLKSDTETRFIRLRPVTQAVSAVVVGLAFAWMVLATAILMLDSISAGSSRDQVQRQQALYEERLNALSVDRDVRVEESASAHERFNLALDQVSQMQARLLASDGALRDLQTSVREGRPDATTRLANGLADTDRLEARLGLREPRSLFNPTRLSRTANARLPPKPS